MLLTSHLVCILPPGHGLADKKVIEALDLDGEAFIGTGNWQLTWKDIERYFDGLKVRRKVQIDTQLNATVAEFVLCGAGVSLIDPVTADRYKPNGLVVKPFLPSIEYNYYVIFPENRPRSRLAEQFVDTVKRDIVRYAPKSLATS